MRRAASTRSRALGADGLDLDRGGVETEAERAGAFPQGSIHHRILDLGDTPATAAHQELARMRVLGPVAAEEGVERIQPMHQPCSLKELERPVHRLRRRIAAFLGELRENLVGPDGLMLPPDDLEDPPADRSELELPGRTDSLGRGDGALDAAAMVMGRALHLRGFGHPTILVTLYRNYKGGPAPTGPSRP